MLIWKNKQTKKLKSKNISVFILTDFQDRHKSSMPNRWALKVLIAATIGVFYGF